MDNQQLNIFEEDLTNKPFNGLRLSVVGKISMPGKTLKEKLKKAGGEVNKNGEILLSLVKAADIIVYGTNPSEDDLKRISLNEHDGFYPVHITEDELYSILSGKSAHTFQKVEKRINITYDYYNWESPVINGTDFVSRVSSPFAYDYENFRSRLAQKEIYVPDMPGVDMIALRQLIGNIGGYANLEYYTKEENNTNTDVIMLSDDTLDKLKQGIKDNIILYIESKYDKSASDMFNIQFTCESEFISWIKARLEKYPDESSITLLNRYFENKK